MFEHGAIACPNETLPLGLIVALHGVWRLAPRHRLHFPGAPRWRRRGGILLRGAGADVALRRRWLAGLAAFSSSKTKVGCGKRTGTHGPDCNKCQLQFHDASAHRE